MPSLRPRSTRVSLRASPTTRRRAGSRAFPWAASAKPRRWRRLRSSLPPTTRPTLPVTPSQSTAATSPAACGRQRGARGDHPLLDALRGAHRAGDVRPRRRPRGRPSLSQPAADRDLRHGSGAGSSHRRARLRHLVAGRASLPARRIRVHLQHPVVGRRSRAPHPPREDRLRLQHRAHLASPSARRGLRHGRYPHRRARGLRRRARLPLARSRDLWQSHAGRGGQPRAVRRTGGDHPQGLPRGVVLAPWEALHAAARGSVPRPLHHVEVWQPIVSGSARSLDFMARHGIKGVISATAESVVERWLRDYQEAARRHGRALQLGEDVILGFRMCLDETEARAVERARPYFEEHAKFMAPLGMLRYSEEHVSAVAARQAQSPTGATLDNGVRNRSWLCGPPARIVDYLKSLEVKFPGLEHVKIAWALGTPRDLMLEQLARFAREVMPAFTSPAGA